MQKMPQGTDAARQERGQPARMLGDRDEEQTARKPVQSGRERKKQTIWEE